jgi:signal transduction histidine kinase
MRRPSLRQEHASKARRRTSFRCAGAFATIDRNEEVVRVPDFTACLPLTQVLTQEVEQRRISRALHNDLGQKLALLDIQIERMKSAPDSEARMALELEALRGRIAGVVEDLHRISYSLHPVMLDNVGLVAGRGGLSVTLIHGVIPPAPPGIWLCLYRVVHEAIHNLAKYARAKRATVSLGIQVLLQVLIMNAECGFDPLPTRTRWKRLEAPA